ncbi:MAG: BlaI/MecI/CopY family transcriptional regulator [Verrucomicrobia bacterium]|nr:MAG: BlaI/MecI/CopY family transcriptional regulator [Verrucomicrobiota bacterium]
MPAENKASRRGRNLPRISEAELVVMKVVWEKAPVTANQVVNALENQRPWRPKTIHTLLSRLVRKRALAFDKKGREYHFRPLVKAAEYAHAVSRSFLSRFFDGQVAPFLACFLEWEKLSNAEMDELRRILNGRQK